jgi:hypothetical protein
VGGSSRCVSGVVVEVLGVALKVGIEGRVEDGKRKGKAQQ